jgi:hypothetical protein
MSPLQKGYRVYGYDHERKVVTSDWIEATSDEEALARAAALGFTKSELWLDDRLVAEIEGEHCAA